MSKGFAEISLFAGFIMLIVSIVQLATFTCSYKEDKEDADQRSEESCCNHSYGWEQTILAFSIIDWVLDIFAFKDIDNWCFIVAFILGNLVCNFLIILFTALLLDCNEDIVWEFILLFLMSGIEVICSLFKFCKWGD